METNKNFPVRPVLRTLRIGETADFPVGRDPSTHEQFGDRRQSIRCAAHELRISEGKCFTVRVESERTRVTRLADDPGFVMREPGRGTREGSVRAALLNLDPCDELVFPAHREPYLRSLAGSLRRTHGTVFEVHREGGSITVLRQTPPTGKLARGWLDAKDPLFK